MRIPQSIFFVSKQTQINLNKVFKIRRSSRNDIIAQLKCVLSDELPKIIIKTDIKDFYETIQHNKMLPVIDSNPLLSIVSKRYIHKILSQYTSITTKAIGLPRGIGVSACLSEIYMQKLDKKVNVKAKRFTAKAKEEIEALGGKAEVI